jgi:hypothetical protein
MQLTPRAKKEAIRALDPRILIAAVIKKNPGRRFTRHELNAAAKKEKARRLASIAYTAGPGWHKAAKAFGGRGVRLQGGFARSKASGGSGSKASAARLVAQIVNAAPAAAKIGMEALQTGVNNVARDLIEYGNRKLQQRFNQTK